MIVWGVDCSKDANNADVAKAKVPLSDAMRFQSWLEGAISGCTVPPHTGVRNATVLVAGSQLGFVITYIPKSDRAPHQMVGKHQYYIRAGSDFVPTPHQVLSGMFGKRPQPNIYPLYLISPPRIAGSTIIAELGIAVRNGGPVIATDLYLNVMVWSSGGNSQLSFGFSDPNRWSGTVSFENRHVSVVTKPEIRLPPEAQLNPVTLYLQLSPPFTTELRIEYMMGCINSPPYRAELKTSVEQLAKVYSEFMSPGYMESHKRKFQAAVFSIPEQEAT